MRYILLFILLLVTSNIQSSDLFFYEEKSSDSQINKDDFTCSQNSISNANNSTASKSVYMALKTNALYDVVLIPNIGFEIAFQKNWSVNTNWMYAWWHSDRKHNYWRIYGGDLELRYWLGEKAKVKPLQGHHIGAYGQMLTYDFEFGGRGYLGDKWSYAFGLSYGYSHPISKRLNLDFSLGIGYLGGKYKEYLPEDGCYVWQSTKQRHWFGPTKAEISLVWLLGRDNVNIRKGGKP